MGDLAMKTRKAKPDDSQAIAEIHVLSAREAYRPLVDEQCLDRFKAEPQTWKTSIETANRCVFVLVNDDQVQGVVEAAPLVDLQGKGMGAALMKAAIDCLLDHGVRTMFLFAAVGLARAEALYERAGGRVVEVVNIQLVPGCTVPGQQWKWDNLPDASSRLAA